MNTGSWVSYWWADENGLQPPNGVPVSIHNRLQFHRAQDSGDLTILEHQGARGNVWLLKNTRAKEHVTCKLVTKVP